MGSMALIRKHGIVLKFQRGDESIHYFPPAVKSVTEAFMGEINGATLPIDRWNYVEPTAGMRLQLLSLIPLKVDDKVYSFDDKGISTEVTPTNQFIRDDFWN